MPTSGCHSVGASSNVNGAGSVPSGGASSGIASVATARFRFVRLTPDGDVAGIFFSYFWCVHVTARAAPKQYVKHAHYKYSIQSCTDSCYAGFRLSVKVRGVYRNS